MSESRAAGARSLARGHARAPHGAGRRRGGARRAARVSSPAPPSWCSRPSSRRRAAQPGARAGARRGRGRAAVRRRGREGGARRPARRRLGTARTRSTSWPRCRCSPTATSRRARAELAAAVGRQRPRAAPEGRQVVVRAVIETCYLEPAAWRLAARMAQAAGCDGVVCATGLGPEGATPEAIDALRAELPIGSVVKAQGGIRSLADAQRALDAGADLLGVTDPASLLAELAAAPAPRDGAGRPRPGNLDLRRSGGTGRRTGLKIRRGQLCAGSIPASGMIQGEWRSPTGRCSLWCPLLAAVLGGRRRRDPAGRRCGRDRAARRS